MSQYEQMFREEANEQLEIAEQALLSYETSHDPELIGEAFRALHTFKGAAHMFDLKVLGDFAHMIESVLDGIRQGVRIDEIRITDKLLAYLDHLKKLMDDPELKKTQFKLRHSELLCEVSKMAESISDSIKLTDQNKEEALLEADIASDEQENMSTYYMLVSPKIPFTSDSDHPLFNIMNDVMELGQSRLTSHYREDNQEELSHWDIYLACQQTREDLEAQFMFIDDDVAVEVHKVANFNLFKEMGFEELLKVLDKTGTDLKVSEIMTYVASLKDSLANDEQENGKSGQEGSRMQSIRVSTGKIEQLMNLISELVTDQAGLNMYAANHPDPILEGMVENIDRHLRQLRDIAFEMSLVRIDRMLGKFRRMVRDCATATGKNVEFIVSGENTELDKSYIDTLSDPIMHILRNCVDHGIETPEQRIKNGKNEKGTVMFRAFYSGANVHIEITDDGKGLDPSAIYAKAKNQGLVRDHEHLTETEILNLIFLPGFSTASNVTEVSGRGVGMDVVRKNIESIRGEILITSEVGKGTRILIKVPLTLSIIDGLLVRADGENFILPLRQIIRCYELNSGTLKLNFNKLLYLEEEHLPYIDLREDLLSPESTAPEICHAITMQCTDRVVAIVADEIVGEYQAVLKPVGDYYKDQEFVSGATILGDGKVALVLDPNKLVELKLKQINYENR